MVSIVPQPVQVQVRGGEPFRLAGAVLVAGPTAEEGRLAYLAAGLLGSVAGQPVPVARPGGGASIHPPEGARVIELRLDPGAGPEGSDSPERYSLEVGAEGVVATAPTPAGLLHAIGTLRQLAGVPEVGDVPGEVPAVVVHDAPRYPWRGLSLDVVRHFFGLEDLERVVDLLADHRLNVLHLHLTDDQGWRIESPSRPDLVALSSGSDVGGGPGGYLTLADFDALQEYAAERYVRVVPEIDVPGHVNAATHAYGELVPGGVPTDVYDGIEVGFSRLTYDLPATEPFLRDVLTDLARATRGEHLHIGGDEVLTMGADELARFIELCEQIVLDAGKKVVAWQEAAHADVHPGTIIQFWDSNKTDVEPFLRAAARGARFLMSPGNRAYLDMKYTPEHPLGLQWAGFIELRDSYEWDPEEVIAGLPREAIEGVEAAVWTETLRTRDELFSMLLPRLAAVAEVAWSDPATKDWESFRARVADLARIWRREGTAFHETPQVDW